MEIYSLTITIFAALCLCVSCHIGDRYQVLKLQIQTLEADINSICSVYAQQVKEGRAAWQLQTAINNETITKSNSALELVVEMGDAVKALVPSLRDELKKALGAAAQEMN